MNLPNRTKPAATASQMVRTGAKKNFGCKNTQVFQGTKFFLTMYRLNRTQIQKSIFFLAVFLFASCSSKKPDALIFYLKKIEQLKVKESVTGYDQKRREKHVRFLWVRAREFGFPYGKNGVLHIIEETRTKDGGQKKNLIVLLTKNRRLGIRRIDYKLKDTAYEKSSLQKILESSNWRGLQTNCSFTTEKECKTYREWISVAMTPELRAILKKTDRHTTFRLYGEKRYYDFDARYDWLPSKDSPLKRKLKKKEKDLDDFLKEFPN